MYVDSFSENSCLFLYKINPNYIIITWIMYQFPFQFDFTYISFVSSIHLIQNSLKYWLKHQWKNELSFVSPRCGEKWWERKVLSFFLRSWQHEVEARNVKFEFLYTCHVFPSSSPLFFIIIILQCIFFISSIVFFWFTIFKSKVWT